MTPCVPYTIRCYHYPLSTTQFSIVHFFHPVFLIITRAIQNVGDFPTSKLDGLLIWVFWNAADAKALHQCSWTLGIAMSQQVHNCPLWALNKGWTAEVHSMQFARITCKHNIHCPTKTCWFNVCHHKNIYWKTGVHLAGIYHLKQW